ncbi:DUF481 domain-containing protein [Lewinella sp. JB7]|uniref:DUF481 domain-containing protein n=1 Tax=Lewinella sp. JB7 TaxID=2962887 RepID=UPI0020C99860|nr:DUF481 domain-containing protein [Lewinella sp. JB7]MCP9235389.1 DUF481 domain-containing protein [Lewinella sp. JB7]
MLLTGLACSRVSAQIVNIEDKRKGFDSVGWYGQIDLGGNLTRNKAKVISLNGSVRVDRKGRQHALLALADYRLVQVSGDNALNAGFAHLRYAYYLSDRWRWEAFTQVQYNEQLRLGLRTLVGTGPRLKLFAFGDNRVYVGVLYMYEYDEVAEGTITYRDHRLSSYLSFSLFPLPNVTLSNTTYYQPVIPDFRQPRLSSITAVTLKLTDRLAFNTRYSITHDALISQGLDDVPATSYDWTNGLRYSF